MSREYKVTSRTFGEETIKADDAQITSEAVKLLNGKGKDAVVVLYLPSHEVIRIQLVQ